MLKEILEQGFISLSSQAILFYANEIRTAAADTRNAGKPYLHGSFVGKDSSGEWTSQKLIHIFPIMGHLQYLGRVLEEDKFFLVMGNYSERETDQSNMALSMSEARFAIFEDGEFTYSEGDELITLKGESGQLVTVDLRIRAQFLQAATLNGDRPRPQRLRTRPRSGMGGKPEEAKPEEATKPEEESAGV